LGKSLFRGSFVYIDFDDAVFQLVSVVSNVLFWLGSGIRKQPDFQ